MKGLQQYSQQKCGNFRIVHSLRYEKRGRSLRLSPHSHPPPSSSYSCSWAADGEKARLIPCRCYIGDDIEQKTLYNQWRILYFQIFFVFLLYNCLKFKFFVA